MKHELVIQIDGKSSTPDAVRLKDLFDVLLALEAASAAAAAEKQGDLLAPFEDQDFHLVRINEGSTGCVMTTGDDLYRGFGICATAIVGKDISALPERSRDALLAIQTKARIRNWTVELAGKNGIPTAMITPDSDFLESELTGWSTIFGTLLRIGGAPKATAQLQLSDGRRFTADIDSQALATSLSPALYHEVSLEGIAKWGGPDLKLIDFKVTAIGAYDATSDILDSLKALSHAAGDFWDNVEADEYIRTLRSE
jgi:hypothetical protein